MCCTANTYKSMHAGLSGIVAGICMCDRRAHAIICTHTPMHRDVVTVVMQWSSSFPLHVCINLALELARRCRGLGLPCKLVATI